MSIKKEELNLVRSISKKIARAENTSNAPLLKQYTFIVTAGRLHRNETIIATSQDEAEKKMFEKHGDLDFELTEVKG